MTDIAELADRARQILPEDVFTYFAQGAGAEDTLSRQEGEWGRIGLRPRILRDVSSVTAATELLGGPVSTPVVIAPMALLTTLHPDGEVGVASAARKAGALFVHSMRSSRRLADVAREAGAFWQQIYVLRDRGVSDDVARAAAANGAGALVLTVDTPYVARKGVALPANRPATGILPDLDMRNADDQRFWQAADVSPRDLQRLADASGLPVVAKGVLRGDEAKRCVDAGAAAVVVSTHGGRQLDGVRSSAAALPEVVQAVDGRAEVYVDGGVRRGVDVVRALALGAQAVWVGRPVGWALATGGAAGVHDLLVDLTGDVVEALGLAGCASCQDVGPDLIAGADTDLPSGGRAG